MIPSTKNRNLPRIMAVDLGILGGICWNLYDEASVQVCAMPENDFDRASAYTEDLFDVIVAENVRIFPGFSIKAGATFMVGRGFLEGCAASRETKVEVIEPQEWISCYTIKQSKHFSNKKKWKDHLLEIAKKESPSFLVNEINLKTCDAFLIWNYIARRESGNPMKKRSLII